MDSADSRLIRQQFNRVYPVQIFSIVVVALNTFIDSIITSRLLGTEAMAAIGLFAPIATAIGVTGVLTSGVQVMCAERMGRGEPEGLRRIFTTTAAVLLGVGMVFAAVLMLWGEGVAALLGGGELLRLYMLGFAPGIVGNVLSGLFLPLLALNNDTRLSYAGTAVMTVSNIALDLLFGAVLEMGIFGMGLATSVSYLLSAGVMLLSFLDQRNTVCLQTGSWEFSALPTAVMLGLPSVMFTVGCTVKGYALNTLLLENGGTAAVAAMSVQNTVCWILGAIPVGAAGTVGMLGGIYYGEEDRTGLLRLMRYAFGVTVALSLAVTVGLMLGASALPSIYYPRGSEAWEMTRRMLLIFPSFLVFNGLFSMFMRIYQCQGKVRFVNVLSLSENLLIAALAAVGIPFLGSDAAWLAFPAAEIACIAIIGASVFCRRGRVTFALEDWLKLEDSFGAKEGERMDLSIRSMEEVVNISESVVEFLTARGVKSRTCMAAGLAVEEMAGNTVQHGFVDGKPHSIDVRLVCRDGEVRIRLRDDCTAFDPLTYAKQFQVGEDPAKNLGIRLISRMAGEMVYLNNVGMNVLLIRL